jgi:hypothetical protein
LPAPRELSRLVSLRPHLSASSIAAQKLCNTK